MKARLEMIVAVAVAVAAIVFSITLFGPSAKPRPPRVAHAVLRTNLASYLGVYAADAPPAYQPVAAFAKQAGRQPNLIGYFSGWLEPFKLIFARAVEKHGVFPFVQIDPTDASIQGIANGVYDGYLRAYAESVREFGDAVVIGFGHEMNAPWYPWGYGHVQPGVFIAAWRHIVNLFHSAGADNVTWLWTVQADTKGTGPLAAWWPGPRYVTWVGVDGYYFRPKDTFASVFGATIDQVRTFAAKPVLLAETAVGPAAGQDIKILDLFHGLSAYKTLGLVWFNKSQDDGIYHQDWRIDGSRAPEVTFRLGVKELAPPVSPAR